MLKWTGIVFHLTATTVRSAFMKRVCTSNAPMFLGILATIIGLPSAILSGSIYILYSTVQATNIYMYSSLTACFIGLIFALLSKAYPYTSGTVLILSALLSCITLFIGNALAFIVTLLYLIAGFLCFTFTDYIR